MSKNLMETVPGGESDQYSSQDALTQPHGKTRGQLSTPSDEGTREASSSSFPTGGDESVDTRRADPEAVQERGERTAENVRYGQGVSEGGAGGMTAGQGGGADQLGDGKAGRHAQGYGGKSEMSDNVGA